MSGFSNPYHEQSDTPYAQMHLHSPQYPPSQSSSHSFADLQEVETTGPFTTTSFSSPTFMTDTQHGDAFASSASHPTDSPQHSTTQADDWSEPGLTSPPVEAKPPARIRRKASAGEHVKHRRTRSGCYTCRSRRVKCDEGRPVCERCRKGSRDCVYPEPKTDPKSGSSAKAKPMTRSGSMEDVSEEGEDAGDESVDELEDLSKDDQSAVFAPVESERPNPPINQRPPRRPTLPQKSRSDSSIGSQAPSTSTIAATGSSTHSSVEPISDDLPWTSLPRDQKFYLDYHRQFLNHNHYQFKHDSADFVHSTLLGLAMQYAPLRFAVIGFAAFHHTVNNAEGKLPTFLTYYNHSISLLRKSLTVGQRHTMGTLLTILQLAAFEEYLGDWVNLLGHQRAACEMLLELYSPESLASTATDRTIFSWYARFDIFAGILGGHETRLGLEWFHANEAGWIAARDADPTNMDCQIETFMANHRGISVGIATLNAKLPKGEIDVQEYMREMEALHSRIIDGRRRVEHVLAQADYRVMSLDTNPDPDSDAILGPFQPGQIFHGPAFSMNHVIITWASLEATLRHQLSLVLQQPQPQEELFSLAMEMLRVVDGIDRWHGSPAAALIPAQAGLGLACLFIPKDERYIMWCRRKLAKIECLGHIYAPVFRTKIAEAWDMPELQQWWLPDPASCPPIVRSLRSFIEQRSMKPRDQLGEDIRGMKAMFARTSLDNSHSNSPESIANTIDSGGSSSAGFGKVVGSPSSNGTRDEAYSPSWGGSDFR